MRGGVLNVFKFIAGVILLPVIITVTIAFNQELAALKGLRPFFMWGMITYVVMHLFVFTPQGLYRFWQRIFEELLGFNDFLSSSVPLAVPLLTTLILLVYYILNTFFSSQLTPQLVLVLVGFTFAMHITLTAQDLYDEDSNPLKPRYIFSMGLVYIISLFLLAALLGLDFRHFSVSHFLDTSIALAKQMYQLIQQRLTSLLP